MRLPEWSLIVAAFALGSQLSVAQTSDWGAIKGLPEGQLVKVFLASGDSYRGTLHTVSDDAITISDEHPIQKQDFARFLRCGLPPQLHFARLAVEYAQAIVIHQQADTLGYDAGHEHSPAVVRFPNTRLAFEPLAKAFSNGLGDFSFHSSFPTRKGGSPTQHQIAPGFQGRRLS